MDHSSLYNNYSAGFPSDWQRFLSAYFRLPSKKVSTVYLALLLLYYSTTLLLYYSTTLDVLILQLPKLYHTIVPTIPILFFLVVLFIPKTTFVIHHHLHQFNHALNLGVSLITSASIPGIPGK